MLDLVQNTLDGIAAGSAYALLAIGFTLIFGVMRRLNIAFGPSIMVGIFLGAWVHVQWSAGLIEAALATFIGALLASIYIERLSFAAIRGDAALASMASSFALWMQLEQGVSLAFPGRTTAFPTLPPLPDIQIAGLFLGGDDLLVLLSAGLVLLVLHRLIYHSHFGLEMRALADSAEAAAVSRININRVAFLTFCLAALVGAVAGLLIAATDGQITPKFGLWATMKGLIAMMIGGLGSLRGALLGGLVLGIVEAQAQWYLGAAAREIVVYGLLFLCLIVLPGGIAGVRDTGAERKL
ncbi:branched-chain amino acid ABC transporter permease [Marivita hallyeonensis]|uniref:Branched-chain amino acid transport system permease protein n=1 Tax=Marivita hallyeonensis TaxID=996342 RepID=A0A1M5SAJ7_9RHOB|nr:branched-chain amino acid ABC transporter permease [Marivita hallyeonensis]SHH35470.1 branched-chain amino acid transport system permease protein [Marivita hallyeonensis]